MAAAAGSIGEQLTRQYVAVTLRGLEDVIAADVAARLPSDELKLQQLTAVERGDAQGHAAAGKLLLSTATIPPSRLQDMPGVEMLLALLGSWEDIPLDGETALPLIKSHIQEADWDSALACWRAHHVTASDSPSFRATAVRDGEHDFKSPKLAGIVGFAVGSTLPFPVDLTGYELNVIALLDGKQLVVGLLIDPMLVRRKVTGGGLPRELRPRMVTVARRVALKPSTAYTLLKLAEPRAGDVMLDCVAGVGTIPIEAAHHFPGTFSLAGEMDGEAVELLARNCKKRWADCKRNGIAAPDGLRSDARRLPLRDATVDVVCADLPFGHRCLSRRAVMRLYPPLFAELARVVARGGRVVLLAGMPSALMTALQPQIDEGLWQLDRDSEVIVGGLVGLHVYLLRRL